MTRRSNLKTIVAHERDHEYQVEHLGDAFIIRTNWQAYNFRLVRVPIGAESERSRWQDLVAHRDDEFIEDFDVFRDFLALEVRSGGLAKIRIVPLDGREPYFIPSDAAAYAAALATNSELDTEQVRYTHASLSTPTSVYEFDMRSGEQIAAETRPCAGCFRSGRLSQRILFRSGSGRCAHPGIAGLPQGFQARPRQRAPLLQYAYGAYGLSA